MFKFTGDTGVYLMYCYARINGIIEKSLLVDVEKKQTIIDLLDFITNNETIIMTKETRELMIHIIKLNETLNDAIKALDTTLLTKYMFNLCTYFNGFIAQKNGKIIGSSNEKFGIGLCLITSKILEELFDIMSFESVEHI
jgi:arginyl-tRNA synthetase